MPKNAATGRRYSGINVLILWGAVIEHGFPGQSWLTFRQALSLGGNVRKGEHGTTVVYADRFIPDDEKKRARTRPARTRGDPVPEALHRLQRRLSARVCPRDRGRRAAAGSGLILPEVEALIAATGADFRIGGDRAFYAVARLSCRCRRRTPISSRSIGTGRRCTNSGIGAARRTGSAATCPARFGSK